MHLTANISVPQKNFIAIDLHSDNAVICVRRNALNKAGELVGKNIWCGLVSIRDGLDSFVKALLPYCQDFDHVAVVESTYNWYCLADIFEERGWLLRIADPSTVSQANLKSSKDRTDAQYLAERLRVGSLKHYLPLSYSSRALWDLCRYRMAMVQDCASLKIKLINLYRNQLSKNLLVADLLDRCRNHMQSNYRFDPDILEEFKDPNIRLRVAFEVSRIAMLEEMIEECNAEIQKQCKDQELVKLCKTIPGCGPVLSAVICTEIGTMQRFKSAGDFMSYCRLCSTSKLSNGKSKGLGNAKNGNAYLSWAFTEVAQYASRNPVIREILQRLLRKYGGLRVKAIRTLAAKIARVTFYVLKNKQPFYAAKCFGIELTKSIKKKLTHKTLREDAAVVLPTVAGQA